MDTPATVRRTLRRIDPVKAAIMSGLMYATIGLIFLPFILIFSTVASHAAAHQAAPVNGGAALPMALGIGFGIAAPIFYGVMGFILGLISAALYNLYAGWVGGIEVEVL